MSGNPGFTTEANGSDVLVTHGSYKHSSVNGTLLTAGTGPTQCNIALDTLPINGLTLAQGVQPLGPVITMTATGITIAFGGPVGCKIELSPTGITLSYGPPGVGSSIKLDALGVTLQAGPMNKIALQQTGLNVQSAMIDLMALASLKMTCLDLTETAAKVTRTGGLTMMM